MTSRREEDALRRAKSAKARGAPREKGQPRSWGPLWLVLGIAAAIAVVALLALRPDASDPAADDDPRIGDAAREVVYFYDYRCGHCKEFEETLLPGFVARQVDGGNVSLVLRTMPIIPGEDSWLAAEASQYIWERHPDVFWAWHDELFALQGAWSGEDDLVEISVRHGVGEDGVRAALEDRAYRAEVRGDERAAQDAGVRGTPTLVYDGRRYGADELALLEAVIADDVA